MDLTFLKPGRGRAENKIHMAADVAAFEILPSAVDEDGVLPAEETAVAETGAVAIHPDGEGLADGAGGIFKGEIFRGKIIRINRGRRRLEGADGFALGVGDAG